MNTMLSSVTVPSGVELRAGTLIDRKVVDAIAASGAEQIRVRSVLTCEECGRLVLR